MEVVEEEEEEVKVKALEVGQRDRRCPMDRINIRQTPPHRKTIIKTATTKKEEDHLGEEEMQRTETRETETNINTKRSEKKRGKDQKKGSLRAHFFSLSGGEPRRSIIEGILFGGGSAAVS